MVRVLELLNKVFVLGLIEAIHNLGHERPSPPVKPLMKVMTVLSPGFLLKPRCSPQTGRALEEPAAEEAFTLGAAAVAEY